MKLESNYKDIIKARTENDLWEAVQANTDYWIATIPVVPPGHTTTTYDQYVIEYKDMVQSYTDTANERLELQRSYWNSNLSSKEKANIRKIISKNELDLRQMLLILNRTIGVLAGYTTRLIEEVNKEIA